MPISSNLDVMQSGTTSSSVTVTNPTVTTSSTAIAKINANRLMISIYNNSSVNVYIDFQNVVSTSTPAFIMEPGALYECPIPYTGAIYALVSGSGSGSISVREFVA